jgi:hypothetical protein
MEALAAPKSASRSENTFYGRYAATSRHPLDETIAFLVHIGQVFFVRRIQSFPVNALTSPDGRH